MEGGRRTTRGRSTHRRRCWPGEGWTSPETGMTRLAAASPVEVRPRLNLGGGVGCGELAGVRVRGAGFTGGGV